MAVAPPVTPHQARVVTSCCTRHLPVPLLEAWQGDEARDSCSKQANLVQQNVHGVWGTLLPNPLLAGAGGCGATNPVGLRALQIICR